MMIDVLAGVVLALLVIVVASMGDGSGSAPDTALERQLKEFRRRLLDRGEAWARAECWAEVEKVNALVERATDYLRRLRCVTTTSERAVVEAQARAWLRQHEEEWEVKAS